MFYKFIKQFLCILDESYRIEQVTNGIFQTTLNLDKQQSVSDALLHPLIDLLKTELTDYVKLFCSDASGVLTFSQFKKVFQMFNLFPHPFPMHTLQSAFRIHANSVKTVSKNKTNAKLAINTSCESVKSSIIVSVKVSQFWYVIQ